MFRLEINAWLLYRKLSLTAVKLKFRHFTEYLPRLQRLIASIDPLENSGQSGYIQDDKDNDMDQSCM